MAKKVILLHYWLTRQGRKNVIRKFCRIFSRADIFSYAYKKYRRNNPLSKTNKKTIRDIISQWVSLGYVAGVTIFLMVFIGRQLEPSAFAIFLYIQAVALIFSILQEAGFSTIFFREHVNLYKKTNIYFHDLLSGYIAYLMIITILAGVVIICCPISNRLSFLIAIIFYALRSCCNMFSSIMKGEGDFQRESLWKIQRISFIAASVITLLLLFPPRLETVFTGYLIGQALVLCTRTAARRWVFPKLIIPGREVLKSSIHLVVINVTTLVYIKSGIILLKQLQPDIKIVGYYGVAFQFIEAIILFATPIAHIIFRLLHKNCTRPGIFNQQLIRILWGALACALLLGFFGSTFSSVLIHFTFGESYQPAAKILSGLMMSLVFLLPNFVLTQAMLARNGEYAYAKISIGCTLFCIILNLILIPGYLATGPVISLITTEALLSFLAIHFMFFTPRKETFTLKKNYKKKR
ncbi:MAG: hypothetical protein PHV82_01885 [Victivallaceae bacterium]|nr:hypothetical protein [Victivallaceae bacterium]